MSKDQTVPGTSAHIPDLPSDSMTPADVPPQPEIPQPSESSEDQQKEQEKPEVPVTPPREANVGEVPVPNRNENSEVCTL